MFLQLIRRGTVFFLVLSVWLCPHFARAEDDLASLLRGLGATSPSEIERTVGRLGVQNDLASLPALEALRDRRLRMDEAGALYIVNEDGATVRDAVSGAPVEVDINQLRTPVASNVVRRTLAAVLGQLQLQSP